MLIDVACDKKSMARELLLGQKITQIARVTGVERMVQSVSKRLGVNCGCAKRAARLNSLHAKLLKRKM